MDLEKILEMWKKDSHIDDTLIDEAALKIPQLHMKYLTLHSEYVLLSKKKAQDLRTLQHKKNLYYSGRAKPEEYEDEPFDYKVMKSDVPDRSLLGLLPYHSSAPVGTYTYRKVYHNKM